MASSKLKRVPEAICTHPDSIVPKGYSAAGSCQVSISCCATTIHRTHTHLLRTIIANPEVECILRAKTLQLYLTGVGR